MNIIREKRDLYDANRNLTKKTVFKGEPIPKGNYIVVVLVFIQNSEGKFLIQKRSKRKNGKIEHKKIPVSPMLKPFIKNGIKELIQDRYLRDRLKEVLPDHILYDLRTTFYTRLKECNVADNAIKEFVGHSLGALGNTYTDLSDEYLLKEGAKYVY